MSGGAEFRNSQGIVPYGVGAIVDFADASLMAAGLDMWPQASSSMPLDKKAKLVEATKIIDGRLQRRLTGIFGRKISMLLSPVEAPERNTGFGAADDTNDTRAFMPFVRFPKWHFCPRCRTLWDVPWNTQPGDANRLRCSSMVRLKEGTAKKCGELRERGRPQLIPVRFAVACKSGHMMDFPWQEWAHLDSSSGCSASSGELFLVSTGASGLAGVQVVCSKCHAKNTMQGAFDQNRNPFRKIWTNGFCPGERPWLGPAAVQPDCTEQPVTIQRGASNAYFATTINSILIPPYSKLLRKVLDDHGDWPIIESLLDSQPLVDGVAVIDNPKTREALSNFAKKYGIDPEAFIQAALEKHGLESDGALEEVSEVEYRSAEYKAFLGPRPPHSERRDFDVSRQAIEDYSEYFQQYFESVVMIPRLRETRALTGFGRIVPPANLGDGAELSLFPQNWFPASEVRGEGIFFVLRDSVIRQWLSDNPEVDERVEKIIKRADVDESVKRRFSFTITPELLLVHTLAHVLIHQLTYDSGYNSSSIRERIYVSDGSDSQRMCGLLIYTASGDSEGTLGGLVRQGLPGRFDSTFKAAVDNSRLCSSDPLCTESEGQGVNGLNLAACHACALLPETSCEAGNMFLDRAMLIGTPLNPKLGLFNNI